MAGKDSKSTVRTRTPILKWLGKLAIPLAFAAGVLVATAYWSRETDYWRDQTLVWHQNALEVSKLYDEMVATDNEGLTLMAQSIETLYNILDKHQVNGTNAEAQQILNLNQEMQDWKAKRKSVTERTANFTEKLKQGAE